MSWRRILSRRSILYVILDKATLCSSERKILKVAEALSESKADIIQFRFKDKNDEENFLLSCRIKRICKKSNKCFIVNNHIGIACMSGADGIHLGMSDISHKEARKILGADKIIGRTTHTIRELERFSNEDVDYMAFGPVFETSIKPYLKGKYTLVTDKFYKWKKPIFFIGGISLDKVGMLKKRNMRKIVVCRDIILHKDPAARSDEYIKYL
jgi:thiamine-phosphate pyrophosphorylase